MKFFILSILLVTSFSAASRELEFMEYFSIYTDYDGPSINLGMYHGEKFTKNKKKRLERRKVALKKWKAKKYYGVLKNKVIPLEIKSTTVKCYVYGESIETDVNCNIRMLFKKTTEKILFVITKRVKVESIHLNRKELSLTKIDFSHFNKTEKQNPTITAYANNWFDLKFYEYSEYYFHGDNDQGYSMSGKSLMYDTNSWANNKNQKSKESRMVALSNEVEVLQHIEAYLMFDFKFKKSGNTQRCFSNQKVIELCFDKVFIDIKFNSIISMNEKEYYVFIYKNIYLANDNDVLLIRKTNSGVVEVKIPGGYTIAQSYK